MSRISIIRILVCGALFSCAGCCDAADAGPTIATLQEIERFCCEHYSELIPAYSAGKPRPETGFYVNSVLNTTATYDNAPALIRYLEAKGDPNHLVIRGLYSDTICPLPIVAAANGASEVMQVLLQHPRTNLQAQTDPRITGGKLWNALHAAVNGGHPECVRLILHAARGQGIDLNVADEKGKFPADHLTDYCCMFDVARRDLIADLDRLHDVTGDFETKQKIMFCITSLRSETRRDIRTAQIRQWLKDVENPADVVARLFDDLTASIAQRSREWFHALWRVMPASDFAELLPGGKAGIVYEQLPTNAQQQKLVQRQTLEALLEYDIPVQDDVIQQIRADDAVQRNGYVFRSTESYCATIARRFLTNRDDRACMRMLKNEYTRRVFLQQKGALETLSRLGGVSAALRLWGIGAVLRFSAIAIASYIGCRIAYPVLSIIPTFLAGIWTCNFFLKDSLDGNKKKQEKLVKLVAAKCSDLK